MAMKIRKIASSKYSAAVKSSAPGNCLSLSKAGRIVKDAIPSRPNLIDITLEEVGLITENQRLIFRQDVLERVREAECNINKGDIPNGAKTTIREVRDTIATCAY